MKIDLKELLTLPTYILAAIAIASGVVLFSPESFVNQIYMSDFRNDYGFIIGITFLLSSSILVLSFFYWFFKWLIKRWLTGKLHKISEKKLNHLNDYQKAIIYMLYTEHNRTARLPLNDGSVSELEYHKMIGRVSTTEMVDPLNPSFSYLLQPWMVSKLENNLELLNSFHDAYQRYESK